MISKFNETVAQALISSIPQDVQSTQPCTTIIKFSLPVPAKEEAKNKFNDYCNRFQNVLIYLKPPSINYTIINFTARKIDIDSSKKLLIDKVIPIVSQWQTVHYPFGLQDADRTLVFFESQGGFFMHMQQLPIEEPLVIKKYAFTGEDKIYAFPNSEWQHFKTIGLKAEQALNKFFSKKNMPLEYSVEKVEFWEFKDIGLNYVPTTIPGKQRGFIVTIKYEGKEHKLHTIKGHAFLCPSLGVERPAIKIKNLNAYEEENLHPNFNNLLSQLSPELIKGNRNLSIIKVYCELTDKWIQVDVLNYTSHQIDFDHFLHLQFNQTIVGNNGRCCDPLTKSNCQIICFECFGFPCLLVNRENGWGPEVNLIKKNLKSYVYHLKEFNLAQKRSLEFAKKGLELHFNTTTDKTIEEGSEYTPYITVDEKEIKIISILPTSTQYAQKMYSPIDSCFPGSSLLVTFKYNSITYEMATMPMPCFVSRDLPELNKKHELY